MKEFSYVGSGMTVYQFYAAGTPAPKGSTKAFMRPGMKYPVVTADNGPKQKAFSAVIQYTALQHGVKPTDKPVKVRITFNLARPKSLPKRVTFNTKKPDLDKLARQALDALTGIAYHDDAQVVALEVFKEYAVGPTGASISIMHVDP